MNKDISFLQRPEEEERMYEDMQRAALGEDANEDDEDRVIEQLIGSKETATNEQLSTQEENAQISIDTSKDAAKIEDKGKEDGDAVTD